MNPVPILTWEAAQRMPHPDRAWTNRPSVETEPMYNLNMRSGYKINLNNYCMKMEYDRMRSERGYGLGYPTPREERLAWEQEMIERFDPDTHMLICSC